MKLRIIYFRQILLAAILIILCQHKIFSQEADSSAFRKPGMFVGISFGPSQTNIINVGTRSVSELLSGKKYSFSGSVEVGYFFSKFIGLSSGIGYNSYNAQLSLNSYKNFTDEPESGFDAIDSENEPYFLKVNGSGIKEEQKIGYLSVPICINLRIPINKSIGFFLQPGINLAIPLSKSYQSSGTFTYKGYYPAYNVLLENLPDYGFPNDLSSQSDGKLELNPLSFFAVVSGGFDYVIQNKIQLGIAACYYRSLSSISNYPSPDNFQLSSDVNLINSLMGGSSKTTAESVGVKITLRYFLK